MLEKIQYGFYPDFEPSGQADWDTQTSRYLATFHPVEISMASNTSDFTREHGFMGPGLEVEAYVVGKSRASQTGGLGP